jgi:hypothetical protein
MFYDEEEINNELSRIEEQEEMNHIRWLMVKESKRTGILDKMKEAEISQWDGDRTDGRTKKRFFSMFRKKNKEKDKRFTNLMDILNEEENRSFSKY